MVYQNGSKVERLKKNYKKIAFYANQKICSRKLIWCYEESDTTTKNLTSWALKVTFLTEATFPFLLL